jgi:hypothetical protein
MTQRGISHVIFEIDSKNVVDAIYIVQLDIFEFSSLICNIRNILSLNSNFKVKFIKRQANMVAHKLARAVIRPDLHMCRVCTRIRPSNF